MAKIARKTQKIFASSANADELVVFGTEKTGSPIESTDVEVLQSNEYLEGWSEAIKEDKAPYLSEMNAVQYGLSYQSAYILQEGIPEWDDGTTYYKGSIVKVVSGVNATLYISIADNNTGHAVTSTSYWKEFSLGSSSTYIGRPIITLGNTLESDEVWLEGAVVSRTTYSALFAVYGTTYGVGDGSTTFQLPDFRNRAIWGANTFGYIAAGLPDHSHSLAPRCLGYAGGGTLAVSVGTTLSNIGATSTVYKDPNEPDSPAYIYGRSDTVQPPAIKVRVKTKYK